MIAAILFYLLQLWLAVNQLINVALLGGWADETISSHTWRSRDNNRLWGFARSAIDTLFFWEQNHCKGAYMAEVYRRQSPPESRQIPQ